MHHHITYVADLSQDVDDIIAADALIRLGILDYIVCDPEPDDEIGIQRQKELISRNITISNKIPPNTTILLVGGALTKVADFLTENTIDALVINGGFAGKNICSQEHTLRKFQKREAIRTYNFNLDVHATNQVLTSDSYEHLILVGKNVCHSPLNTTSGIWSNNEQWISQHHVSPQKRLHDLLMVYEGLSFLHITDMPTKCIYKNLWPNNTGLNDNMTCWYTSNIPTKYRRAQIATGWKSYNTIPAI